MLVSRFAQKVQCALHGAPINRRAKQKRSIFQCVDCTQRAARKLSTTRYGRPRISGCGDGITPICIDWALHRGTPLLSAPYVPHVQMRPEGGTGVEHASSVLVLALHHLFGCLRACQARARKARACNRLARRREPAPHGLIDAKTTRPFEGERANRRARSTRRRGRATW
jgi:hypothetical protein